MPILEPIQAEIESHPIVLFHEGTRVPDVGFSTAPCRLCSPPARIRRAAYRQSLEEPNPRHLPRYSNWPTFPPAVHPWRTDRRLRQSRWSCNESGELARMIAETQKA